MNPHEQSKDVMGNPIYHIYAQDKGLVGFSRVFDSIRRNV